MHFSYCIRSGIEEIYTEREQLLQEIQDICNNYNRNPKKKRRNALTKEKQIVILGKKDRETYALQSIEHENSIW